MVHAMKVSRRCFAASAASAVLSTAFAHASPASPLYRSDLLRADLDWLLNTMIDVGVKPFAYCDQSEWQRRYETARAALNRPMDALSYWLVAGAAFAALNDGHVSVLPDDIFNAARIAGMRAFPLLLLVRPEGTFVRAQTFEAFPVETRIERIDGLSGKDIAQAAARLTGGQRPSLRYSFATDAIAPLLKTKWEDASGYTVTAQRPDGSIVSKWLPALTRAELSSLVKQQPAQANVVSYTFSRLNGGTIGYIDYLHCEDRAAFQIFLKETFASIKSSPISGLIVDIRKNSGGASSLNNDLWSYLTDKPFAQFGGSYIKVSDRLKKEYGMQKYISIYGDAAWNAPNGTVVGGRSIDLLQPGPNELRYSGPVYLLIGSSTFSSAMACAVAAKDYRLATIVGEETAEPVNSTGEVYSGTSPHVGLNFGFTTKFFVGPKPRPDTQGVIPDVAIATTEGDLRQGRDPVLQYAVDALKRH